MQDKLMKSGPLHTLQILCGASEQQRVRHGNVTADAEETALLRHPHL